MDGPTKSGEESLAEYAIQPLAGPAVDGVRMVLFSLEREAQRMGALLSQLGQEIATGQYDGDNKLEAVKVYTQGTLGLLKEQRERAKLRPGQGRLPLTEAEYRAKMRSIALELQDWEFEEVAEQRKGLKR